MDAHKILGNALSALERAETAWREARRSEFARGAGGFEAASAAKRETAHVKRAYDRAHKAASAAIDACSIVGVCPADVGYPQYGGRW